MYERRRHRYPVPTLLADRHRVDQKSTKEHTDQNKLHSRHMLVTSAVISEASSSNRLMCWATLRSSSIGFLLISSVLQSSVSADRDSGHSLKADWRRRRRRWPAASRSVGDEAQERPDPEALHPATGRCFRTTRWGCDTALPPCWCIAWWNEAKNQMNLSVTPRHACCQGRQAANTGSCGWFESRLMP